MYVGNPVLVVPASVIGSADVPHPKHTIVVIQRRTATFAGGYPTGIATDTVSVTDERIRSINKWLSLESRDNRVLIPETPIPCGVVATPMSW